MIRSDIARRSLFAVLAILALAVLSPAAASEPGSLRVPVLVYHRFGPTGGDMMVSTATFQGQLQWLHDHGYTVIPLRSLVDYRLGRGPAPPPRAVVITADDGNKSVYSGMFPLVRQYGIPVTLFIYPSAISNAAYALTWDQLRELQASGRFDVQSHTYWHPNFRTERARLPAADYDKFVALQLTKSKEVLARHLGGTIDLLAWPYGIHDDDLARQAARAGYVAAFSLEGRPVEAGDDLMALPRYLVTDADRGAAFGRMVGGGAR
jgi:peptidoglycan/xylan/chitin deacetylase (PgdA/CDA1 family)